MSQAIESAPPGVPQQLAVGATVSSKYGRLRGFTGGAMISPLAKCGGIIVGFPGEGKSHLIQSCKAGYIINADLTSAPSGLQAMMWPGISPAGQPVGDDGRPLSLTKELIEARKALLLDMAAQGQPRPETIFFDTLYTMVRLAKAWSSDPSKFQNQDPRAMWDRVHEWIIGLITDLRNAGYGVFFNVHMTNGKVQLGEDRFAVTPELTITSGFWSKIFPVVENVILVRAVTEPVTRTVEQEVNVRGALSRVARSVTTNERIFYATCSEPDYKGILKARVTKPLPDRIVLPRDNAWDTLESVFADHTRG